MKKIIFIFSMCFAIGLQAQQVTILSDTWNALQALGKANTKSERTGILVRLGVKGADQLLQFKKELEVAKAGKTQVIVNIPGADQTTIHADQNGDLYYFESGQKHYVSRALNEVQEYIYSTPVHGDMQSYDIGILKRDFSFEQTTEAYFYFMSRNEMSISEIADENRVPISGVSFRIVRFIPGRGMCYMNNDARYFGAQYIKALNERGKFLEKGNGSAKQGWYAHVPGITAGPFRAEIRIMRTECKDKLNFLLTCKWRKDFSGREVFLNDFNDIRRTFYQGESFVIGFGYQTYAKHTRAKIEVREQNSGKIAHTQIKDVYVSTYAEAINVPAEYFKQNKYVLFCEIKDVSTQKIILEKTEYFEIIPRPKVEVEQPVQQIIQQPQEDLNVEQVLFELIQKGILSPEEFQTISTAQRKQASIEEKDKASKIIFKLVQEKKITAEQFQALSSKMK